MIFRPKSYLITLKRAHSLLEMPRKSPPSIAGGRSPGRGGPDRDRIQAAFRAAAKRHHPDLVAGDAAAAGRAFRECHAARELLLDYYVRRTFVPPDVVESTRDRPVEWRGDRSWRSVWASSGRSFRVEACLRLAACLALAVGTYYHDQNMPERRKQQMRRRDAQFQQFGPQPPRF